MARPSRAGERARRRRGRGRAAACAQAGFTYIGLLIAIVIIGAALAMAGAVWSTQAQRERETELLWRGDAIRAAIGAYVLAAPAGAWAYPHDLKDLLQDPRAPQVKRYLRRIYTDPMTGAADWKLIRAADGGIMGVASVSQGKPIKRKEFRPVDYTFEDAKCYCDWQFVFFVRGQRPLPVR